MSYYVTCFGAQARRVPQFQNETAETGEEEIMRKSFKLGFHLQQP